MLSDELVLRILSCLPDVSTLLEIALLLNVDTVNCWPWQDMRRLVDRPPLQLQKPIRLIVCDPV